MSKDCLRTTGETTTMILSNKLKGFDEGMEIYRHLDSNEDDTLIPFSISLWVTGSKIVSLLREHISDIDRNEVRMMFDTHYLQKTDKDYWMKGGKLKRDMEALSVMTLKERGIEYAYNGYKVETTLDIYRKIEENVGQIVELLKVVGRKMDEAPDSLYGNFYRYQRSLCDVRRVEADYLRWKRDVAAITFDMLKDRQTFVVAEFLKRKILRFSQIPSDRERKLVDLEKVRPHLPHGYEFPDEFRNCCARFRRFISWDGNILKINYDCYGKYLFQFFYDLSTEERQALIDLDLMLDLIHQDIISLKNIVLPDALATPEARELLEKARQAGYLDDHYQPTISNTMSALLANEIAIRSEIRNKWKVFERFWGRQNMYKDYYEAVYQKQCPDFQKSLYKIFD